MKYNIGDFLRRRAQISPDLEAIVDLAEGKRFSYAELNKRSNLICHALAKKGLRQGDRIALLMYNSIYFVDSILATAKLGAVAVPLNWRLTAAELSYILKDCGATTLVFGIEFADLAHEIRGLNTRGADVRCWIQVGGRDRLPDWTLGFHELLVDGEGADPEIIAFDGDLMFLMYTSGTTGSPKGVMHSHATVFGTLWNVLSTIDVRERDRYLLVSPLYHVGGITPLLSNLYTGASIVLMQQFDAAEMRAVIERERITTAFAVPAMLSSLLMVSDFDDRDFSALRSIWCGASPVPPTLIQKYVEIGIEIQQVYGLTESGGLGCYLGSADAADHVGSTGRSYLLTDLRVVDGQGCSVPPDQPGEIVMRGDHVMVGYWKQPAATAETLRDGWLHTGDVAVMDAKGFVTIRDRIKDMVISGGENIYPAEIENVLFQHAGITDVAVIGQPSTAWGECTFAVVVRKDEQLTEADVIEYCEGKMAAFKVPKGTAFVDEIPRNPTGKPLKRILRERFPGPAPE